MATKATCPKGMYWDPSSQKCVKPGTENSPLDLLKKEKERILKTKLKNGGSMKKMKTGGMVNPNAKIQAAKAAGSKGVKSGVNPKAVAAKKATGKSSGGVDTPPKTAVPKAKYGMSITKMKRK